MIADRSTILLSIHPEHAESILCGRKLFEFRRVLPATTPRFVVLYASAPIMRIVGRFEVARTLTDTPAALWAETEQFAGISRTLFLRYFAGLDLANAFGVFAPERFPIPIDPRAVAAEHGLVFRSPQSYRNLPIPGLAGLLGDHAHG